MEKLKPTIVIDGNTYEIKKTRALMVEFQRICKQNPLDETDENKYLAVKQSIDEIEVEINAIAKKLESAREDYLNDPTNEEKKATYNALKKVFKEAQKPLLDNKSEESLFANKLTKLLLDNYEKAIIFALSEQYNMSLSKAQELWESFVSEQGVNMAAQWVYAIGDTLFNTEVDEDGFLAKKRRVEAERLAARRNRK